MKSLIKTLEQRFRDSWDEQALTDYSSTPSVNPVTNLPAIFQHLLRY